MRQDLNFADWKTVKQILNAALDLEPGEREVYLAEACAGDEGLRRRVEELLSSYRSEFMEKPVAAEPEPSDDLVIPSRLGRYEIIRMIGAGGMGKVYLARDNQLDRQVAIKVLNRKNDKNEPSIQRFIQEAKAASALNHPNIVTIHDTGESEGAHFIVMEMVAGRPLSAIIDTDNSIQTMLTLGRQMSKALSAAHSAGITHRDIKPDNIMVRDDGYLKILDFGLARLVPATNTNERPALMCKTSPGAVLGTVAYMSPEQARGEPAGPQTDIFALGIVFYELLTGQHPFEAESPLRVLHLINSKAPASPSSLRGRIPAALDELILSMLAKEARLRPTALEVSEVLTKLSHASGISPPQQLDRRGSIVRNIVGREKEEQTPSSSIDGEIGLQEGSNSRRAWRELPRKSRAVMVTACLVAAGLTIAIVLNFLNKWRESGSNSLRTLATAPQLVKLTTTGNIVFGSISPDGKFAAYVAYETDGSNGVWVKQVASGSSLCVVPAAPNISYWGLTFSRDSNFLYYVTEDQAHPGRGVLYRLPAVGGTAEKLLTNIATHPSFSPDGRQMVFKRASQNKHELIIADVDGRNQQVWATGSWPYDFWTYSWSPDGQTIAYANSREDETGRYWYIAERQVRDGTERVLTKRRWYQAIRGMDWLPEKRGLVVVGEDPTTGLFQLWQLSGDGGEDRRLTNDVNDYWRVSLTADGSGLLTSLQERPGNIFVASVSDPQRARQITAGAAGYDTLAWTVENRLVYSDLNNGIYDIWTMEADGSGKKRLTANAGNNKFPALSYDGRYILFLSNRAGRFCVWRMDRDGSEQKQIGGETTGRVQCSPDSQQAFYTSDASGSWALWKVPIEGGQPERVRDLYSYRTSVSPDGKLLAHTYLDEQSGRVRLAVSPINSDTPIRTFDADVGYEVIRWVDAGNAIAYISDPREIRSQPIAGGRARVLLRVPDELFSFDVSRDGSQIAYISGRVTNNLILIRGF